MLYLFVAFHAYIIDRIIVRPQPFKTMMMSRLRRKDIGLAQLDDQMCDGITALSCSGPAKQAFEAAHVDIWGSSGGPKVHM